MTNKSDKKAITEKKTPHLTRALIELTCYGIMKDWQENLDVKIITVRHLVIIDWLPETITW